MTLKTRSSMSSATGQLLSPRQQAVLNARALHRHRGAAEQPVSFRDVRRRHVALVGWLQLYGSVVMTLCAVMLWAVSLGDIDVGHMNDLGLVSVLPVPTYIALAMLLASFCLTIGQRRLNETVLLLQVGALILMLYGTTTLVEQEPHLPVVWRHVGITEYITRTGRVDPALNAQFDWPGFFILSGFVTRIAGFASAISLTAWAPVAFNVLYLGPLFMILDAAGVHKRAVWLGIWFFYLTNWVGQDSFSPQGLNYFFNLVILGVLLKYFKVVRAPLREYPSNPSKAIGLIARLSGRLHRWLAPPNTPNTASQPAQRAGLMIITMLLFVVSVASHQLTPFATLASVTALVIFRRCTPRSLPIFMMVTLSMWISYMTVDFLAGHLGALIGDVGSVHSTVSASVTDRLNGSPQHAFIVHMRMVITLAVWALAGLGGLRRLRRGASDLTHVLVAIAPFLLLGLQSYGGELLLRAYLFTLPTMVFFMAALFYTEPAAGTSRRTTVAIGLTSLLLLGGFLFARNGNERMDYITHQDVQGMDNLYSIAKHGSVFLTLSAVGPAPFKDIEKYDIEFIVPMDRPLSPDVQTFLHRSDTGYVMRKMLSFCPRTSYLIVTRSNEAALELFFGVSPAAITRLNGALMDSLNLVPIFDNGDVRGFVLGSCRVGR